MAVRFGDNINDHAFVITDTLKSVVDHPGDVHKLGLLKAEIEFVGLTMRRGLFARVVKSQANPPGHTYKIIGLLLVKMPGLDNTGESRR